MKKLWKWSLMLVLNMPKCKIRKNLSRGPRSRFYINAAWFHLPKPTLKKDGFVDGYPIIHVDTERGD